MILKVSARFGGVAALLSITLFSILYFAGKNPMFIPAYLDFRLLLFPIFLVFSIRDFKEYRNNGVLHFWQGFSVGILIVLIISLAMTLYILILGGWIDPSFTQKFITGTMQNIQHSKENIIAQVGVAAYNKTLELIPGTTLYDLAFDYFLKSLPLGIIITILISLVLRNNTN
jgi:hypothetical protein